MFSIGYIGSIWWGSLLAGLAWFLCCLCCCTVLEMPHVERVRCTMHRSDDELLRALYSLCACCVVSATLFTIATYSIIQALILLLFLPNLPSFCLCSLPSLTSLPQVSSTTTTTTTITTALKTTALFPSPSVCLPWPLQALPILSLVLWPI